MQGKDLAIEAEILEDFTMQSDNAQRNVAQSPVQSLEYTVDDLARILRVERRQIFNYARIVVEANWEAESVFKPRLGIYSDRMLEEMRSVKKAGAAQYKRDCAEACQKPIKIEHTSALVVSRENAIDDLDGKIAKFQQQQQKTSGSLTERISKQLALIEADKQKADDRTEILKQASLSAAENQGIQDGLEAFQKYKAAREATIAHLKAQDL